MSPTSKFELIQKYPIIKKFMIFILIFGLTFSLTSSDFMFQNIDTDSDETPIAEKIDTYVSNVEKFGFQGSMLVNLNGTMYEYGVGFANRESWKKNNEDTVFLIGSTTKQFTATGILHLEDNGLLNVSDTIDLYLSDVQDKGQITIHQLLTHSSGLVVDHMDSDFEDMTRSEALNRIFSSELEHEPGEKYLYSNAGYTVLAAIIEIVSGTTYQDYLRSNLFEPAQLFNTGFFNDDWTGKRVAKSYVNGISFGSPSRFSQPSWALLGNGGIMSTVSDLNKWILAVRDFSILSNSSVEKLFTPHVLEFEDGISYYGYGWVIEKHDEYGKIMWHDGAGLNFGKTASSGYILISESLNLIISGLSNKIEVTLLGEEILYAIDTTEILAWNIITDNFDELPFHVDKSYQYKVTFFVSIISTILFTVTYGLWKHRKYVGVSVIALNFIFLFLFG